MTATRNPVFCSIDTTEEDRAEALGRAVEGLVGGIKLGLEFFCAWGPEAIRRVAGEGLLFLDLKLHDIPNTVAAAVRAVAPIRPDFLTIHAAGGAAMLRAAVEAAADAAGDGRRMNLLGVTVLTSLDDGDLEGVGQRGPVRAQVARLAELAQGNGLDGVICSPHEVEALRAQCGADFRLVVPGIRPAGAERGDQKRVMTPPEAMALGADYLVIGRPITAAADPAAAARAIRDSLCRA
jgi:orotidine-5'-phosphate decarboxylase